MNTDKVLKRRLKQCPPAMWSGQEEEIKRRIEELNLREAAGRMLSPADYQLRGYYESVLRDLQRPRRRKPSAWPMVAVLVATVVLVVGACALAAAGHPAWVVLGAIYAGTLCIAAGLLLWEKLRDKTGEEVYTFQFRKEQR